MKIPATDRREAEPAATATGVDCGIVVPSPSRPSALAPQQSALPLSVTPQV